jgi:hypothetical protein
MIHTAVVALTWTALKLRLFAARLLPAGPLRDFELDVINTLRNAERRYIEMGKTPW